MPLALLTKLKLGDPKPINMSLMLVDISITYPYGVIEDVLVKVDGLVFPADFMVMDIKENSATSVILGRPFLETGKSFIDLESSDLSLKFNKEKVIFNAFKWTQHIKDKDECYKFDEAKMKGELTRGKVNGVRISLPHLRM